MARLPVKSTDSATDVEPIRPSEEHRRLKTQLHQQLIANMNLALVGSVDAETLRAEVRRVLEELCRRSSNLLNLGDRERLVSEVLDETFGLGRLEPLLADPAVSDILINGHNVVYVERGGRLERVDVSFNDSQHLLHIVQRIVGRMGRRVDETSMEGDNLTTHDLFLFKQTGVDGQRRAQGYFHTTGIRPHYQERLAAAGVALPVEMFVRRILNSQVSSH